MYNSQYYTCEQIDQRLLQGYLDDYNNQNGTNLTKEQFLTLLYTILTNGLTIDDIVQGLGNNTNKVMSQKAASDCIYNILYTYKENNLAAYTRFNFPFTVKAGLAIKNAGDINLICASDTSLTNRIDIHPGEIVITEHDIAHFQTGNSAGDVKVVILNHELATLENRISDLEATGFSYMGVASASTNPGTPTEKVFYIALSAGTYTNFGNLNVNQGISILKYNGTSWTLDELLKIDNIPTKGSNGVPKSGGVFERLNGIIYHFNKDNVAAYTSVGFPITVKAGSVIQNDSAFGIICGSNSSLANRVDIASGNRVQVENDISFIQTANISGDVHIVVMDSEFGKMNDNIEARVPINLVNLIDWDNIIPTYNKYYKGSTGITAGGDGTHKYGLLPLLNVKPNTEYYLSCIRDGEESGLGLSSEVALCFYSSNNVNSFISSVSGATRNFTTPNNCNYIGISLYQYEEVIHPCLNYGTTRKYTKYSLIGGYYCPWLIQKQNMDNNSVGTTQIENNAVTPEKTDFIVKSKNLFDYTTATIGKYINVNGGLSDNASWSCTDFIKIDLTINPDIVSSLYASVGDGAYNCFYDSSKNFIPGSSFKGATAQIPENAKYVRYSMRTNSEDVIKSVQVEYGNESTPFVQYGFIIKEQYLPPLYPLDNSITSNKLAPDAVTTEKIKEINKIIVPANLYLLSGVNNDVFFEPILKYWNPYKYDVKVTTIGTNRNYVKAIKRVVTLNNPTATGMTLELFNVERDAVVDTKTLTFKKGIQGVGDSQIKVGIIGDSYTDGGGFTPVLLEHNYVPNLKLVGTRQVSGYELQCTDGRSGWSLNTFFNVQTGADYFNPFYHPQGNHRYWGNTAFWKNVCGGSPSGYGTRYTQYSSLCDSSGWPVSPTEGDVIYDSVNSAFKEYQSGVWTATQQTNYTWEFNYSKYLSMWNVETPDVLCVMLGVNDTWIYSNINLTAWGNRINVIKTSYLSANPNGKFVILTANTVTHKNVNNYSPLSVHNNMQALREFVITNFDGKESENIYVVDTAQLIDSENAFVLTDALPFDGYTGSNREVYANDGQHPRLNYTTLGYSLAAFIQYYRN